MEKVSGSTTTLDQIALGMKACPLGTPLSGTRYTTTLYLPSLEVTRTFSLMVRLFGNVMSGEFVIALVVALAGLFVPIPLMVLEILVGIVQAYIFTVLATVFIGAAVGNAEKT